MCGLSLPSQRAARATDPPAAAAKKTIVLIAGPPSHGFGSHEHRAGCLLLADALNQNMPSVKAVVVAGGWPENPNVLDDAAAIVIFADGGGRHPILPHLDQVARLMKKGVGLVCLHYAVEVPKGRPGQAFLDWIGGYFETYWSVNPHWTPHFKDLPTHPVTRGVRPFAIRDEWYYHMRFRSDRRGWTPLLSDLPPAETLRRKDGAHSNNPHVRAAVLDRKEPQVVAWAYERSEGGRGFGFTGGHFHWNWAHDDFRKIVLNGIVWTARIEVPPGGVPSKTPTVHELLANQDFPPPKQFNPERIQQMIDRWKQGRP
ncbi:MAG TPA: hypothetical protein EYP14_03770 [Planctomycetaceae bacterium]|nr:hypothetical protein [Planctomycetaceae bacterium]